MKQVYLAMDRVSADLACGELRALGFDAVVIGDMTAIPSAPFPSVWVPDSEAGAATAAWKELNSEPEG